MWSTSGQLTTGTPPIGESGLLAENTPLTTRAEVSLLHQSPIAPLTNHMLPTFLLCPEESHL